MVACVPLITGRVDAIVGADGVEDRGLEGSRVDVWTGRRGVAVCTRVRRTAA